jgi:hypothetical protein
VAAIVTGEPTEEHGGDAGARLLDAVHDWARSTFGEAETSHLATGAAECTWCPVCQLIAALRGDRPDVTEKLATAATAAAAAIRAVLDAANAGPAPAPGPPADADRESTVAADADPVPPPTRRPRRPRVQRIDLDHVASTDADPG